MGQSGNQAAGPVKQEYDLTAGSIDRISYMIEKFLMFRKVELSNRLRIRLSFEEALLRLRDHSGEEVRVLLEMGVHFRRAFIRITVKGESWNPLAKTDDLGYWVEGMLSSVGMIPAYSYRQGKNEITLYLKRDRMNPALSLVISAVLGILLGMLVDFVLPPGMRNALLVHILQPIQEAYFRILNMIAGPIVFLTVLSAVCGVGSVTLQTSSVRALVSRVLILCGLLTAVLCAISLVIFPLQMGYTNVTGGLVEDLLEFFLEFIPGDILTPFINGDSSQLILLAFLLGNGVLAADTQVDGFVHVISQAGTVGTTLMDWISRLSPIFVTVLLILGFQGRIFPVLLGLWKPLLLFLIFNGLVLTVRVLYLSSSLKVSLRVMFKKLKEPFMAALSSFSVDAAFGDCQESCEELGMDRKYVQQALPIGLLCYMPSSTFALMIVTIYAARCYEIEINAVWILMLVFLAVVLQAASPPIAGGNMTAYAAIFLRLGIPTGALTIALIADIIVNLVISPLNQTLLQLEMLKEADSTGFLDRNTLYSENIKVGF